MVDALTEETSITADLKDLREALQDLTAFMTGPLIHESITREAGVSIDRALFYLLLRICRREPVKIDALAQWAHRDHSTVSRQVEKLVQMGFVERRPSATDARVREVIASKNGWAAAERIFTAYEKSSELAFETWSQQQIRMFTLLVHKFVQDGSHSFEKL